MTDFALNFASDNAGPAHPKIMEAMMRANDGYAMPYGNDPSMDRVREQVRELFEAPEAAVYLVPTGSAANALALACLANPWDAIFCHRVAHVEEDECGAPEFYSNGAKLTLVDGVDAKMTPDALRRAIEGVSGAVHGVQRGPVTVTQVTELGTLYSLDEIAALSAVSREFGLKTHLDGARFANACAAWGCSAPDMSSKAGIDVVSFGGTKNGCLGVEAVVFFDPAPAWEFELRRKRGGHLFSKHRFLAAQMEAYLTDGLWLEMAAMANGAMARLRDGLGDAFSPVPEANLGFAMLPRKVHQKALDAGAQYYVMGALEGDPDELVQCRLVCDWTKSEAEVDALLGLLAR